MLEVRDISVRYGAIQALHGVSLTVNKGEIVTLIGCNGAGKTTTLKTISGLLKPVAGTMTYEVDRWSGCPRTRSCSSGSCNHRRAAASFPA